MNILDKYRILSDINSNSTNNLKIYNLLKSKTNINCYIIIESIKKIDLYDFLTQILVYKRFLESKVNVKIFISDYTNDNIEYTNCINYLFGLFNIKNIEIVSFFDNIELKKYHLIFNNLIDKIEIKDINIKKKTLSQILDPISIMSKILSLEGDIISLGIDRYDIEKICQKNGIDTPILISNKVPLTNESLNILDSSKILKKKILDLYFPLGIIDNIIFLYYENFFFKINKNIIIEREEKHGGTKEYNNIIDLKLDYTKYKLHPLDIKNSLIKYLEAILTPIRKNYEILNDKIFNSL